LKQVGVVAVCAASAFGAAFVVARAGRSPAPQRAATPPAKPAALGDPAATAVALRFTGKLAPLKLPPRHLKPRPKPAAKAKPAAATPPTTPAPAPTPAPTYTPPAPTYSPPAPTYTPPAAAPSHSHSGGGGGSGSETAG